MSVFRAIVVSIVVVGALALAALGHPARAQERAVDLDTRPGVKMRALLNVPADPVGSVILLAGGHGHLNLGPDGRIGWGAGNHLVRTRAAYVRAGFAVAVPDVADDLKVSPPKAVYRASEKHAVDLGALTLYMRQIKAPVWIIGTSYGTISAANAVARLDGPTRPDGMVLSSGMLMHKSLAGNAHSVERSVRLERLNVPTLFVHHQQDGCAHTPAADVPRLRALLTRAPKTEVFLFSGGENRGDPCEPGAHHGFNGIEGEVVAKTVAWLKANGP